MVLTLLAFFAIFVLISSIGILIFYRQAALRRLAKLVSRTQEASLLLTVVPEPGARLEKLVKPFEKIVPRSPEDVSTLRKRLNRAGYREKTYVSIFYLDMMMVVFGMCFV